MDLICKNKDITDFVRVFSFYCKIITLLFKASKCDFTAYFLSLFIPSLTSPNIRLSGVIGCLNDSK
ncbi:hypothetical protein SHVI106290_11235 [Shewanella violacea]